MNAPRFGVYVHWPYCTKLCPYCDFNVYRARGRDAGPLLDAIVADIEGHHARLETRAAETVFLGGGTPSLLGGADIARILVAIDRTFGLANDAEVTLESNPEDRARFADHAAAGVNRFSVGLQSLDDAALHALGRAHDSASAIAAVEMAQATGRRVSLDMIYAREGQTLAAWEAELRAALALPAEHLSLYQLTIEPGTAFARAVARKRLFPPDNDRAADLYELTQRLCAQAGAPAYEISNHARGKAARARHNVLYWTGGDWLGVGPGAHGRIALGGLRTATKAHDRPDDYASAVLVNGVGWESAVALATSEIAEEAVLMGLRLADGLERAPVEALRGTPLDAGAIARFRGEGLLVDDGARLRLTDAGRLLGDHIAQTLAQ